MKPFKYTKTTIERLTLNCTLALLAVIIMPASMAVADKAKSSIDGFKCKPRSLIDNRSIDLTNFKDQLVYVDFWASWCGPCKLSFPFLNELHREFDGKGLKVIAISVDDEVSAANKFLSRNPADFLVAIDRPGVCPSEFEVRGMPSSYVIGKNGDILYKHVGFRPSDPEVIRKELVKLMGD